MSNDSLYAMYVIGRVESNHNWAAVNENDPITLGMLQWYGPRAAGLIRRCANLDHTGYAAFKAAAPTLAGQSETNSIDFTTRWLTREEAQAWRTWADRDENHLGQEAQWNDDYAEYVKICDGRGFPSGNIKERIFFMTMYHQSPVSAFRVLQSCSASAPLERLYTTALNDGVLGRYRNRYSTAYDMLKDWDGVSPPPDFGQVEGGGDTPGGNPTPIQPTPAAKAWIIITGDNLVLTDNGKTRYFKHSTARNWVESGSDGSPIVGPPSTDKPSEPGGKDAQGVADWVGARLGKYSYSQGPGRLDPEQTGHTDCSGLWCTAYRTVLGIDVGEYTGTKGGMAVHGRRIAFSDTDTKEAAVAKAKAGDLLLLSWTWRNPDYDHVVGFAHDGQSLTYSHGGGMGPQKRDAITDEMNLAVMWEIRRYV